MSQLDRKIEVKSTHNMDIKRIILSENENTKGLLVNKDTLEILYKNISDIFEQDLK